MSPILRYPPNLPGRRQEQGFLMYTGRRLLPLDELIHRASNHRCHLHKGLISRPATSKTENSFHETQTIGRHSDI